VETEASYSNQLNACVSLYIQPLRAQLSPTPSSAHTGKPVLTADEVKCLFRNIETLAVMHTKFLGELRARYVVCGAVAATEDNRGRQTVKCDDWGFVVVQICHF
jgi:hypothetical protein